MERKESIMATPRTNTYLKVLYDYQYKDSDGQDIHISSGEECVLVKKATAEWWYVVKKGEKKPIYVPANYVEELHRTVIRLASEDPQTRKKKSPPPKPPVKPRIKKSVEAEVLKELDSVLEHAFDNDPVFENGRKEESSQKVSSISGTLDTKHDVEEESNKRELDFDNAMGLGLGKLPHSNMRPYSSADFHFQNKEAEHMNLRRQFTKSNSAGSNPNQGEVYETQDSGSGEDISGGSKKKLDQFKYELPDYANIASLGIQPPKPKQQVNL